MDSKYADETKREETPSFACARSSIVLEFSIRSNDPLAGWRLPDLLGRRLGHLEECMRNRTRPEVTFEDGLRVVGAVYAALFSASAASPNDRPERVQ